MVAIGAIVASITVDVIFLAVVIDVFNVYHAADVTSAHTVFFATAIVIVVTVAVTLITIDTVSLVLTAVIFVAAFTPTIETDIVCHNVISVVIVDFFVSFLFADVFVVVFIGCGMPQFRLC